MHPLSLRQLTLRESDSLRFVRRFAPSNRVRCHPKGGSRDKNLLPPVGEVPRSGDGVSKRTGAQGAIATEHPVRRHQAQSVCICGASRCQVVPFFQRRGCFGRALRCSLSVQERLAKEPGLGILCRMPTEDPRAGPKLIGQPPKGKRFNGQVKRQLAAGLQVLCRTCTPLLHTKAPSFCGPAGMMSAVADRGILVGPAALPSEFLTPVKGNARLVQKLRKIKGGHGHDRVSLCGDYMTSKISSAEKSHSSPSMEMRVMVSSAPFNW